MLGVASSSECSCRTGVEVHDLVLIILESKDGAIDSGVRCDDHPILSANAEYGVHVKLIFDLIIC
jgi:hypothetical protein